MEKKLVTDHTIPLRGCTPDPLMNYLKALGVLRLVSEQADPSARGWWQGDAFFLQTTLNEDALCDFFLERYEPTPLVGPWGARSGFFNGTSEKSGREALEAISRSKLPRLASFGSAIDAVRSVLVKLEMTEKADSTEAKRRLMMQCRAMLPDQVLDWLDATYVLLDEDTKWPPLLGTGGNEGSGSYMSGFSQQVAAVLIERQWDHALRPAVFGESTDRLATSQTPGHFSPAAAGGANAGSSSEGSPTTNPWDYLLMLEGTLMFAAACVKRLEQSQPGTLSYPFCVRQTGVGYASAASGDEGLSRAEMWLPLWTRPSTIGELTTLFSEGRATLGSRRARSGVDFARSITSLGTDRGITEFERYAFQQRNGLSYFAIPLGRFKVQPQPQVKLLDQIDDWLDRFRGAASADTSPASAGRASRGLEKAIFELCRERSPARLQNVLIALGKCEQVLATSAKWRAEKFLRPIPLLSADWLIEANDGSTEFRLAASLAGIHSTGVGPLRKHLEPVASRRDSVFFVDESAAMASVVWSGAKLDRNLGNVVARRVMEAVQRGKQAEDDVPVFPGHSAFPAAASDVALFLHDATDDARITDLIRGLALLNWLDVRNADVSFPLSRSHGEQIPDATYGLLKLCHTPHAVPHGSLNQQVRLEPRITRLLRAGRVGDATRLATQRLRGSSLPPSFDVAGRNQASAQRLVAALLFPIDKRGIGLLARRALKTPANTESTEAKATSTA
jgi:CRISPR-associated protein Csx17